ncbi:prepilin-type N-terminal cleavage/methylation domain-containing protein [Mizugakiibacter sediminis]|uniref:Type II secretion system protein H n=1 Tax=Mizugakiibacter sediminis TaxID=1475481 RepID=A0A0K8QNN5_9GAMM|nr:GspH/FimT family pseudopilin [Mizugakiibacter sediminis]GAP66316.1 prepilin-type N-terminal cleavage/methylation domain-containing protein [Mizugakiibacter sediminis]
MDGTPRRQRGVTLIEQLLAVGILAILVVTATPALGGLLARNAATAADNAVVAALQHARERAVRSGAHVVLCPSRDGAACVADVHWEHGWLLAWDRDRDGEPDAGVEPIAVGDALPPGTVVLGSAGRTRLVFRGDGSAAGSNVSLTICHRGAPAASALGVVMANSGRIRQGRPSVQRARECVRG